LKKQAGYKLDGPNSKANTTLQLGEERALRLFLYISSFQGRRNARRFL
jgi:hypothetical protein